MLYPMLLTPIYKELVWGGNKLNKDFGFDSPFEKTGEAWTVSVRDNEMNIVENGIYKGMTLDEVINKDRLAYLGSKNIEKEKFPLLVKMIDANDKLSIQVHPDDKYALEIENYPQGKNEMWYIMSAPKDSKLIIGLKSGTTKEVFEEAIENGNVESYLNYLPVEEGDVIDIPAGLVHAITSGLVILEIQQNSDITYRIFDYNRKGLDGEKRPLHIKQSLDTIDFSNKIKTEKTIGIIENIGKNKITNYIENPYFTIMKYDVTDEFIDNSKGESFSIFSCLSDVGVIIFGEMEIILKKGQSLFVPAGIKEIKLKGKASFLKSFV